MRVYSIHFATLHLQSSPSPLRKREGAQQLNVKWGLPSVVLLLLELGRHSGSIRHRRSGTQMWKDLRSDLLTYKPYR